MRQDGNRLTVALNSNLLFTSGDAALSPEGATILKRIGAVLGQLSDKFVQVAGHTLSLIHISCDLKCGAGS